MDRADLALPGISATTRVTVATALETVEVTEVQADSHRLRMSETAPEMIEMTVSRIPVT